MIQGVRWVVFAAVVVAAGCSEPATSDDSTAGSGSSAAAPVASSARRVHGRAPVVNGIPPIIVLEPRDGRTFPAPSEAAALDQLSLTFIPPVLFVRAGYPAEFWNSDEVLHNVRVMNKATKVGEFNVSVPTGEVYRHTFTETGLYDITCDVHPAMMSALVVSTTPYAMQADAAGAFAFEDVAPGAYTAVAYVGGHPMEMTIDVAGPTEVVFRP